TRLQSFGPILDSVDGFLRLLDADSHLERLRRHGNAAPSQHLISVGSAVPDGQDDDIGRNIAGGSAHASKPAIADVEVLDAAGEANLTSQSLDFPPDRFYRGRETVAAQMGPVFIKNGGFAFTVG